MLLLGGPFIPGTLECDSRDYQYITSWPAPTPRLLRFFCIPKTLANTLLAFPPSLVDGDYRSEASRQITAKMVKTIYAISLFTATGLAAPLRPVARDDGGNFIGAGTAHGAVNDAVNGLLGKLTPRAEEAGHTNLIDNLPVVGSLLGGVRKLP